MEATISSAQTFLEKLNLPALTRSESGFESIDREDLIDFDGQKNQAMVVGSDIVSFVKGVTVERRQDVINSCLLAQLAANKQIPDRSDIFKWYDLYFNVLANIGWVIQDTGFSSYEDQADGLSAHEAILRVATSLLAGSPTALMAVTSTLEAMRSMNTNSPWITIFNRESKSVKTSRFQIALAEQDENDRFFVMTMAFGLKARSELTQILFFKIRKDSVSLKHRSGKVTINDDVLSGVRELVKQRLVGYGKDFIASIPI